MDSYLYYRRGDEWVRVSADSYDQTPENIPGQCVDVRYRVTIRAAAFRPDGTVRVAATDLPINCFGPIGTVIGFNDLRPTGSRAVGVLLPCNGVIDSQTSSDVATAERLGYTGTRGNATRPTGFVVAGIRYLTSGGGLTGVTTQVISVTAVRQDGLPDDCGSRCTTKFYRNDSLTLELPDCPEVTNGRGCSDCCAELLPLARSIRI